jgi:tetratricopeptide (TPR) repeat protein
MREASPSKHRFFALALTLVLVLMASRTFVRSFDYRSETAHAQATVHHYPASVRGRARLGLSLLQEQGLESARPHLEYVLGTSFQGSARADVLRALGEYFVATGEYQRGIKLLAEYTGLRPRERAPLEALSKAYFEVGRLDKAHEINVNLVNFAPKNVEYRYKVALTAWLSGERETAHRQVRRALELDPNHLDALLLGATVAAPNDPNGASRLLERANGLLQERGDEPLARQRRLLRKLREKLDYAQDELDQ